MQVVAAALLSQIAVHCIYLTCESSLIFWHFSRRIPCWVRGLLWQPSPDGPNLDFTPHQQLGLPGGDCHQGLFGEAEGDDLCPLLPCHLQDHGEELLRHDLHRRIPFHSSLPNTGEHCACSSKLLQ